MSTKRKNPLGKSVIIKSSIDEDLIGKIGVIIEEKVNILNENVFCLEMLNTKQYFIWVKEYDVIFEK